MKLISKWVYHYNTVDIVVLIHYDETTREYVHIGKGKELRRKTLAELEQPLMKLEYQKERI